MDFKVLINNPTLAEKVKLEMTGADLIGFASVILEASKKQGEQEGVKRATERYLSKKETSEMLGVDPSTLWHWERRGYLMPVRIGTKVRYRYSDIIKKMEGRA